MIPIFIASNTGYAGRTFISLGLAMKLIDEGYTVGYMKAVGRGPIKKGKDLFDADALFIRETLKLKEPPEVISPFVRTYESQTLLLENGIGDVRKSILDAFGALRKNDFVIVGGGGDLFEGAILNVDTLSLVQELQAFVLMVEPWRGETSADTLYGLKRLLADRFCGGIINKVPLSAAEHVKDAVRPFLEKKGVPVFGVFARDRSLEAVSVRQLNEILNGRVICCEDRLDEFVENFSVGAMDVDSALAYFRRTPNKAVITGAHRSDIQLAAMETSTRCIILTGGLTSNDVVIGKAQSLGIPIISVNDDTFTTIDRIEVRMGKTSIREQGKVRRVRELMDREFDIKRFLKSVNMRGQGSRGK